MTKIAKSLAMIALVAAVMVGATGSYFSDVETSENNFITAGSLDLTVNGVNGDSVSAVVMIEDMKPSQTWYSGPITLTVLDNPGKLYKKIVRNSFVCETVTVTEPECDAVGGAWSSANNACTGGTDVNDLSKVTFFDLEIWVGDPDSAVSGQNAPMCDAGVTTDCWDIIIPDGTITVYGISSQMIYLGTYGERMTENKIVIRQSFHMKAETGNKYQSDSCTFTEEFMVLQTNAPHPSNVYTPSGVVLDSVDIGDETSETGHLVYPGDDWSYVGSLSCTDLTQCLKTGNYGGYDGGDANFRGLMGPDTGCEAGDEYATFKMNAGSDTATDLVLRHLNGSQNDSFNVFVVEGGIDTFVGNYAWTNMGPETWVTTGFVLPTTVNRTGEIEFKLVATDLATTWCVQGWGQVMINWAKITN